ncbi:NAD(P)-dependent oxidoreductase [Psychromicrobium lacuslunae]|nr:NAD(P)-binding domain-containing protein [Psychromicrobium lacuslunae]
MTNTVTVIGLGPMGQAIARVLLLAGREVTVWNRTVEKAIHLEELGARIAATPREAIRQSEIVLISVRGNDLVRRILTDAEVAGTAAILLNLSSDTPASARQLAAWVADQGIRYLGGTMLTPSALVGQSGSTAVLGGDRAVYEKARSILEIVAPELSYFGDDPGAVAALDLALLDAFWTTVAGWSHAVALGRAEGLNANSLVERLTSIVHLAAQVGTGISHDAEAGKYPGEVSTIASAHTTLRHLLQASADRALDTGVPGAIEGLLRRAVDQSRGEDGPSRLVSMIEQGG